MDANKIIQEALDAGYDEMSKCTPIPMVVSEHTNPLNDNSPVKNSWLINDGVCGFAWVKFKANNGKNRSFLSALKKAGLVGENEMFSKSYEGGYTFWVSAGNQSLQKKEAFARGFANILEKYGVTCYVYTRMD